MGLSALHEDELMQYLDAPHIQLGFYWHSMQDTKAYTALLSWLLQTRYVMCPELVAMKSEDGRLPPFDQLVTHNLPGDHVAVFTNWTVDAAVYAEEWLPVKIRLTPMNDDNVQIELGYALQLGESLRHRDSKVVEITAAGADFDVLVNSNESDLPPKVVKRAKLTDRWHKEMFRAICDELMPDYAARRWEYALPAPRSLIASTDYMDFEDMYLSKQVVEPQLLESALSRTGVCSIAHYQHGVFVELVRPEDRASRKQNADAIRDCVKKWCHACK